MKKHLLKVGLSLIVLLSGYFTYRYFNQPGGSDSDGSITFILVDQTGQEVIHDDLDYQMLKADGSKTTLFDIIAENYTIACANLNYELDESCSINLSIGKVILAIEDVKTDFFNSYLEIYHKPVGQTEFQYASKGVMLIEFQAGDQFIFKYMDLR